MEESTDDGVHVLRSVCKLLCNTVCFWGGIYLMRHICVLWDVCCGKSRPFWNKCVFSCNLGCCEVGIIEEALQCYGFCSLGSI